MTGKPFCRHPEKPQQQNCERMLVTCCPQVDSHSRSETESYDLKRIWSASTSFSSPSSHSTSRALVNATAATWSLLFTRQQVVSRCESGTCCITSFRTSSGSDERGDIPLPGIDLHRAGSQKGALISMRREGQRNRCGLKILMSGLGRAFTGHLSWGKTRSRKGGFTSDHHNIGQRNWAVTGHANFISTQVLFIVLKQIAIRLPSYSSMSLCSSMQLLATPVIPHHPDGDVKHETSVAASKSEQHHAVQQLMS